MALVMSGPASFLGTPGFSCHVPEIFLGICSLLRLLHTVRPLTVKLLLSPCLHCPVPFSHLSCELLFILQSLLQVESPNRFCSARYLGEIRMNVVVEAHTFQLCHSLRLLQLCYSISFLIALTFCEKGLSVPFRQK